MLRRFAVGRCVWKESAVGHESSVLRNRRLALVLGVAVLVARSVVNPIRSLRPLFPPSSSNVPKRECGTYRKMWLLFLK
jgi:hypothetical protein